MSLADAMSSPGLPLVLLGQPQKVLCVHLGKESQSVCLHMRKSSPASLLT